MGRSMYAEFLEQLAAFNGQPQGAAQSDQRRHQHAGFVQFEIVGQRIAWCWAGSQYSSRVLIKVD